MELSINDTINAQINTELWSAYLFLSMSANASSKGFKGVAHWFYIQHQKEMSDAKKLIDYLNSIDSKFYLYPIEGVPIEWNTPQEMFEHKLKHDQKISKLIHANSIISKEKQDYVLLDFLTQFAKDQLKEENISKEIIKAFHAAENNKYALSRLTELL